MSERAVTFDATGTLVSCPAMGDIYAEVLGRHGAAVRAEDVRRVFRVVWKELDCRVPVGRDRFTSFAGGSRAFWARLLERVCELLEVGAPDAFAASELYHRFASADAWTVYPEVEPVLDSLRAEGLRLAVVSNFDERLPGILAGLGLARRFDAVVYSAALGVGKPHPAIFRHALDRLGVPASRATHVGDDRLADFEGARAAGMEAILLERSGGGCPDLRAAAAVIVGRAPAVR